MQTDGQTDRHDKTNNRFLRFFFLGALEGDTLRRHVRQEQAVSVSTRANVTARVNRSTRGESGLVLVGPPPTAHGRGTG